MMGRFFSHSWLGMRLRGIDRDMLMSVSSESPGVELRLTGKTRVAAIAILCLGGWAAAAGEGFVAERLRGDTASNEEGGLSMNCGRKSC